MLRRRAWLFFLLLVPALLLLFVWQLLLWRMSLRAPLWQVQLPGDIIGIEADGEAGFIVLQQVGGQGGTHAYVSRTRLDSTGATQWSVPDLPMPGDYNPRMSVDNGRIRISGELGVLLEFDMQGAARPPQSVSYLRDVLGIDGVFSAARLPDGGSLQYCRLLDESDDSIAARLGLEISGYGHFLLQLGPDNIALKARQCSSPLVGGIWQADTDLYALIEFYGDPWLGDYGNSRTVALFSLGSTDGLHQVAASEMPGYITSVLECRDGLAVLGGELLVVSNENMYAVASDPPAYSLGKGESGELLASRASSLPLRGWLRQFAYGPDAMEACRLEHGRLRRIFSFRAVLPRSLRSCLAESGGLVLVGESNASHSPISTLNCYRP
ncbi:MAG: hypothetical protein H7A35_05530 [Planctomycetales bacterium]|nr:hypothetical protein [bacterium]UNM09519.1 MAG: hypothetical protein H7A35_05530 [Planctomycetales bacterium]